MQTLTHYSHLRRLSAIGLSAIGITFLVPSFASALTVTDSAFDSALTNTDGTWGKDEGYTTDVWADRSTALSRSWEQVSTGGNPGGYAGAKNDNGSFRQLFQLIADNKATTGPQTLSFDLNSVDDALTAGTILEVGIFGFNNPTVDDWQIRPDRPFDDNAGFVFESITVVNDGTSALNTGGWSNQQVSFDLGATGYDLIAISFYMDDVFDADGDLLGIDNVSVIPEPSAFALITALGSLMVIMLRRRRD